MHDQEERELISAEIKGKTVRSLEWSEEENHSDGIEGYRVMTFTDGSQIRFRLISELASPWPTEPSDDGV